MMPEHELRELFLRAIECSAEDRAALLNDAMAKDRDAYERLNDLLRAHDTGHGLLDASPPRLHPDALPEPVDLTGRSFDGFTLAERLGEGGMGVVYRAREEKLGRDVAIKLMRLGIPSTRLMRALQREATALAKLRHPGIATIHGIGTVNLGTDAQPYFVMEYVTGPNVVVATASKSATECLSVLADICDAVHHAHLRGIIHCDLKPDNILLNEHGQPKVLDFGIARLIDDPVERTLTKSHGSSLLGTIAYMSPERLRGNQDDPDLRADIYALGVIGYQMLGGRMPHDLTGCTLLEAIRRIADSVPPSLARLDPLLRGDPDAIIATAMAPEPERRYQSAAAMAEDIRRMLRGDPIHARSIGTTEHLRRSLRRHRVMVVASLMITAALTLGMIFAVHGLQRARDAESVAQVERAEAARQASIARSVSDFLIDDLLLAVRPEGSTQADITVREVLDIASARLSDRSFPDPTIRAEIHATLGNAYRMLGRFDLSGEHLITADQLFSEFLGPEDPRTLLNSIIQALHYYESGDFDRALIDIPPLLTRLSTAPDLDASDRFDLRHAWCSLLIELGRFNEAEQSCHDLLNDTLADSGRDHARTLIVRSSIARLSLDTGDLETAREMFTEILDTRRRTDGDDDVRTTSSMNNLATVLIRMQRFKEAETLLAEALEHRRRTLGEDHIRTILTKGNLAVTRLDRGLGEDAERMLADTVAAFERTFPDGHPNLSVFRAHHARALASIGRSGDARRLIDQALSELETMLGSNHPTTMTVRGRAETLHHAAPGVADQ